MKDQNKDRFTLEAGQWYAMEMLGDFFHCTAWEEKDYRTYSPIKVLGVSPNGKGNRTYRLSFYHSNYPEGVQGKEYVMETLERGEHYILAKSDHEPTRILYITAITYEWIEIHFPGWVENACKTDGRNSPPGYLEEFLNRHA